MSRERFTPPRQSDAPVTPFSCVEEVWFWFMQACEARADGAMLVAGAGLYHRPCEPADILNILQRLHRNRVLTMDHFRILAHYGKRQMSPDKSRKNEMRAYGIWQEGLEKLGDALIAKGIIADNIRYIRPECRKDAVHGTA